MKLSRMTLLMVGLSLASGSAVKAQSWDWGKDDKDQEQKVRLLGTIPVPAPNPIASTDIVWADQTTGMVFFTDRSNSAVEVINGRTDLYVGPITSGAGGLQFGGTTHGSANEGPNGVVSTPDKKVWAADGDSTVKVLDVDPSSPTYLKIIASISTAGLKGLPSATCTGGYSGTCRRADELAYDPEHNIINVANDEPDGLAPFSTFVNASAPYNVLGQINYTAQGNGVGAGLEQPAWDPKLHRFLQTLPGANSIVVINPKTEKVEKVISVSEFDCGPSGLAVGEDEHVAVACSSTTGGASFPLVLDVTTGHELGAGINQVGGGDELNYNPGENEFVVSANVDGVSTNPTVLGVINGKTGDWIQNAPANGLTNNGEAGKGRIRAGNLAALGSNNHVFVVVHPATAPATDICGFFGTNTKTTTATDFGCVAVFGAVDNDAEHHDNDHRDNDHHDDDGR
jgi:hypothetical protein